MPDKTTQSEASLAVLASLRDSDEWDGAVMELDGNAGRILAIDFGQGNGSETAWLITVVPASIVELSPPQGQIREIR